jgi:hypothetical protein
MVDILKPNKIIFATIKGYDAFLSSDPEQKNTIFEKVKTIDFVPHASSKWWNRAAKKYGNSKDIEKRTGREKFISLIQNSI